MRHYFIKHGTLGYINLPGTSKMPREAPQSLERNLTAKQPGHMEQPTALDQLPQEPARATVPIVTTMSNTGE